jgi:hypothetical protein
VSSTRFASDHAVARYQERVKPCLPLDACKRELMALLNSGLEATDPPAWAEHLDRQVVELSDGILAVMDGRVCLTIATRAGMSEERRARRNEKKARKRRRRSLQTRGPRSRRPDEPIEAHGF